MSVAAGLLIAVLGLLAVTALCWHLDIRIYKSILTQAAEDRDPVKIKGQIYYIVPSSRYTLMSCAFERENLCFESLDREGLCSTAFKVGP